MNERLTTPKAFSEAVWAMHQAFEQKDAASHHPNLIHNPDEIINALADKNLLRWRYPTWASKKNGQYTSLLICESGYNFKFGKKTLCEFVWISTDGKSGIQLFKTAQNFAKENGIQLIIFSSMIDSQHREKLDKFYKHNGFLQDSITYTKIL